MLKHTKSYHVNIQTKLIMHNERQISNIKPFAKSFNRNIVFSDISTALQKIKEGGMVIVMDDENRENEGDIIMAAEDVTLEQCALIIRHTTGILCAPMTIERAQELHLPKMVKNNQDINSTAFTITCDSIHTTTGVSARDRMRTFHDLANNNCKNNDFNRPGHVFPLIAKPGGVLERRGHTEAGVDLCKMAEKNPVALIAELCNDDGSMMRLNDCTKFAKKHDIPLITVDSIITYINKTKMIDITTNNTPSIINLPVIKSTNFFHLALLSNLQLYIRNLFTFFSSLANSKIKLSSSLTQDEQIQLWPKGNKKLVNIGTNMDFVASTILPTAQGQFRILAYRHRLTNSEPIVLQVGDVENKKNILIRVHDQCITSEVFKSLRCDCHQQLQSAISMIKNNKCGAIIYLPQEGRGIGLANKIAAYSLQEQGLDTVDANRKLGLPDDARSYDCVEEILNHMKIQSIKLITNNPLKVRSLKEAGINITARIPCLVSEKLVSKDARIYIRTKTKRMGHLFPQNSAIIDGLEITN